MATTSGLAARLDVLTTVTWGQVRRREGGQTARLGVKETPKGMYAFATRSPCGRQASGGKERDSLVQEGEVSRKVAVAEDVSYERTVWSRQLERERVSKTPEKDL